MQEDRANYGRPREPGDELEESEESKGYEGLRGDAPTGGSPMRGWGSELSQRDERSWSALSHLSVLVWPMTGFLPIAPLIIWLVYKDRSPMVGFQALQSLWYQAAWLALGMVGGLIATIFTIVTLGLGVLLVAPLGLILGLVPFAHQLYAAYKVNKGVEYRYPFIADRIEGGRAE